MDTESCGVWRKESNAQVCASAVNPASKFGTQETRNKTGFPFPQILILIVILILLSYSAPLRLFCFHMVGRSCRFAGWRRSNAALPKLHHRQMGALTRGSGDGSGVRGARRALGGTKNAA